MSKLRAIVIGVGHLGKEHARIYAQHDEVELVGVVDTDASRAQKIAESLNTRSFTKLEDVELDYAVATVAVPTNEHFHIAKTLLEKDKHILVEKPITETVEQALELVNSSEKRELVLQVGHVERYNPATQALSSMLHSPRFIECHRLSPFPHRGTDVGVVLDLMIHDIDIILHITKSPVSHISAVGVKVISPFEDIANARLEFQNGCIANVTTSRVAPDTMRKIRIFQHNAYLSLDYHKQEGKVYHRDGMKIACEDIPVSKEEPLKIEVDGFIDAVKHSKDPQVSGSHGLYALEVAVNIIKLIQERDSIST